MTREKINKRMINFYHFKSPTYKVENIFANTMFCSLLRNGSWLVTSSYTTTANEYTSDLVEYGSSSFWVITSGAYVWFKKKQFILWINTLTLA